MQSALRELRRYIRGKDLNAFRGDRMLRAAVERQLEIISEASRHIPEEDRVRHADIPWRKIADLGNVLRHAYHRVSPIILWNILRDHLPALSQAAAAILRRIKR